MRTTACPAASRACTPGGFSPKEAIDEDDHGFTAGIKGMVKGGWNYDLGTTLGRDKVVVSNKNSANVALFNDTGFTPTNFYAGRFIAQQWTAKLDLSKPFEIGLAEPLNVAFGVEYRKDS